MNKISFTRQLHTSVIQNARRGSPQEIVENEKRGVFRVLDIGKPKPFIRKNEIKRNDRFIVKAPPREKIMKPDQDWASVWPGARTFHPASVPLPVRQGFAHLKGQVTPGKYVNVELMKVPNFLHLTPPAIKKHCEALQKFCTPWPKELEDEDLLDAHFPITEITSDYLNSSSNIRDFRSRVVTFQFEMSSLLLDPKSREKFLRLVGPKRYDEETDKVTISVDRCPYRSQNRDYCDYLVKALYYESRNREPWEEQMTPLDQVDYQIEDEQNKIEVKLAKVLNEGENVKTLDDYKKSILENLNIKSEIPLSAS